MLVGYLLVIVTFDITVVNWYDNDIILKPHFYFIVYLSKAFIILEISTRRSKNTRGYKGL
jgi:hypothetical protein